MTRPSMILIERKEVREKSCRYARGSVILLMKYDICTPAGPRPQLPIEGPWRHASLKGFLKNVDAGKEETGEGSVFVHSLTARRETS